jgi:hypothetical protein
MQKKHVDSMIDDYEMYLNRTTSTLNLSTGRSQLQADSDLAALTCRHLLQQITIPSMPKLIQTHLTTSMELLQVVLNMQVVVQGSHLACTLLQMTLSPVHLCSSQLQRFLISPGKSLRLFQVQGRRGWTSWTTLNSSWTVLERSPF